MKHSLGIIAASVVAGCPATAIACDRAPLQLAQDTAPITVVIDPACLDDPTDTGILFADLAMQLVEAHLAADARVNFTATREVLVETFIAEILAPTLSAN